jgi:hypothetical protein
MATQALWTAAPAELCHQFSLTTTCSSHWLQTGTRYAVVPRLTPRSRVTNLLRTVQISKDGEIEGDSEGGLHTGDPACGLTQRNATHGERDGDRRSIIPDYIAKTATTREAGFVGSASSPGCASWRRWTPMRAKVRLVKSSSLRPSSAGPATFSLSLSTTRDSRKDSLSLTVLMAVLVGKPRRGD